MFLRDTTGPTCRGLVFPEGDIADPNAQRGYRRVAIISVGLFFGCSEGGILRVPTASEEDPRRETAGSNSHHVPEARCSRKGTVQPQRAADWCSLKGTLQTQMSNELPTGWHRRFLTIFRAPLERILAFSADGRKKTRGEKPRVRIRVVLPRPGVPARGHHRPNVPRPGFPERGHCRPTFQHGF